MNFDAIFIRHLLQKRVDLVLWHACRCRSVHSVFHVGGLNVDILELALKLVHHQGDSFQVHGLHSAIEATNDVGHTACDLAHRHGRFDPARHGIDAATEAQQIQRLVLLADRVGRVYACAFAIPLGEGLGKGPSTYLFQLGLFRRLITRRLVRLALKRLDGKLV